MKISRVEAIPVWFKPSGEYHALFGSNKKKGTMVHARETWFANIEYKENVFVKITTDEGITGWGEACAHPVTSETQAGILATVELFGRLIQGRDPFAIGAIHEALDNLFLQGNNGARSAIDIALYDIMGKASGQPVYNLLGGAYQTRFGKLATTPRSDPKRMADHARALLRRGYTAFEPKMTGHLESLDADADRLEAILDAVPKSCPVIADPNQMWGTAKDTINLLDRRFRGAGNLAIEQPVWGHDLNGLASITQAVPHRIVADEAIQNLSTMVRIASGRYADMVSLKLGKCGGFWKSVQMMRIAEAAGLPVRIDWTQGSHLLDTATGHLHAAVRIVGCDPGMDYQLRIEDRPVKEGGVTQDRDGRFVMPSAPGLGLTVDEKLIRKLSQRR
ncbi:MAG: mandelate racemase/muconate lactonizing enzyme family protein [Burkholderiales bacterium]|nr:mandelate racemase/muconate lactonizing enzyme family protein [Burkholderiales bacterium]MCW5604756.1 mandelate racemase/muconate lactonizing enzyme family protein [Burkholderiales bacterium]